MMTTNQAPHFASLAIAGALLSGCSNANPPEPLDSGLMVLNIDPFAVTLSGISSGAYMAQQLHIAHSERVRGVALIGTGPYDCAQGNLGVALTQCMGDPAQAVDPSSLIRLAETRAQSRQIQSLDNLRGDHVWLMHGDDDRTVGRDVFAGTVQFYEHFIPPSRLTVVHRPDTGHLWPTLAQGVACASSDAPYLGACDYDAAEAMLEALYGFLHDPATPGQLTRFNQHQAAGMNANWLAEEGYAYIPKDCAEGKACSLHISFHGCNQHSAAVGDTFATNNGLNRWAESNRIVVLYPQVAPTQAEPMNPQGCWDWWGYTGSEYATLDGEQISAVVEIISHLAGVDTSTAAE
ncbi:MAG: polyhydroxybutyrate depolymerase [Idiomarina sp.]|nr:polyhydroxybutyrate depolymerase [Idiomarina sp.]